MKVCDGCQTKNAKTFTNYFISEKETTSGPTIDVCEDCQDRLETYLLNFKKGIEK